MEELFTLITSDSRTLTVSWDENGIKRFQEANNLKVRIQVSEYQKTLLGFWKTLLIRLVKRKMVCLGGRYNHLTRTITLFGDTISNALITEDDTTTEDKMTRLMRELPKALSRVLAHEFGHAKDTRSFFLDLSWKLLIPGLGQKHLRNCRARDEKIAKKFAEKHAEELKQFFSVAEES